MSEPQKFEIFFIRHANTVPVAPKGFSECDVALSKLGEKQLPLLGERFRGKSFDAVFCSPLIRAVRTATSITNTLNNPTPLIIMPEIIEKDAMQTYKGINLTVLRQFNPSAVLCKDKIENGADFYGDTDEALLKRAQSVLAYFKSRFTYGQKICVVSHGTFGNHFIGAATGMGNPDFIISINNTSVSKIKYTDDGDIRLSFSNDMSHLRPIDNEYEFDV